MSRSFAFLGSGEFEPWSEPIDRWLVERSAVAGGPVLLFPTAAAAEGDDVFDMWGTMGRAHYARLGVAAEVVPLKTREDAERPEIVSALERASAVYFSGGNPAYLADVLDGSTFWRELIAAIDDGVPYCGCSAGVAHLGEIAPDVTVEELSDRIFHRSGLRLFPGWLFGLHWDKLDEYMPGLRDLIGAWIPPGARMLAVDERTAVLGDGLSWTVVGTSRAHLLEDGSWRHFEAGQSFPAPLLEATPA